MENINFNISNNMEDEKFNSCSLLSYVIETINDYHFSKELEISRKNSVYTLKKIRTYIMSEYYMVSDVHSLKHDINKMEKFIDETIEDTFQLNECLKEVVLYMKSILVMRTI